MSLLFSSFFLFFVMLPVPPSAICTPSDIPAVVWGPTPLFVAAMECRVLAESCVHVVLAPALCRLRHCQVSRNPTFILQLRWRLHLAVTPRALSLSPLPIHRFCAQPTAVPFQLTPSDSPRSPLPYLITLIPPRSLSCMQHRRSEILRNDFDWDPAGPAL